MYLLAGLVVLCVCSGALSHSGGVDQTVTEKATGPDVVEATLDRLWGSCAFTNDKLYLRRIAKVEANDGQAAHTFTQNGKDFYGGIWQVTDQMYRNTLTMTSYFAIIEKDFGIKWANTQWKDLLKPLYSALAARLFIQSTLASGTEIPFSVSAQGRHWATDYSPGGNENEFATAATALAGITDCANDQSDIVVVLDGSGSIGAANFEVARAFARNLSEGFKIGSDNTRIGLIQYSTTAKVEFRLGKYSSKTEVKNAINAMKYQKGNTNSADALKNMQDQFYQNGRSSSKGIPRVGIFMTDGKSNDKSKTITEANAVHKTTTTVYAIGVGSNLDASELTVIGSEPSCTHVFQLANFEEMQHFQSQLRKQTCREPSEVESSGIIYGSLVTGRLKYFKLKMKKNKKGITIKIKMSSGATRLYVSFKVRNPGKLVYKYKIDINTAARSGGAVYIPWRSQDNHLDQVLLYAALEGTGLGMANDFSMQALDGYFAGSASVKFSLLTVVAGVLATVWARF